MTRTATDTDRIRRLLAGCVAEARKAAGSRVDEIDWDDYEYTAADLEYVTDTLGRKPAREEWAEAGCRGVGSAHVADAE